MNNGYVRFAAENLKIIDKNETEVDLNPNPIQNKFLTEDYAPRSIILKARQQGFSSIINAMMVKDFLLEPHTYNMVVADNQDNAEGLLKRVKDLIASFEEKNKLKIPLKYNTKYQLYWEDIDSTYQIGTAQNIELGRSKTISNLHLSEAAFYPNLQAMLAGAVQAVIPSGRVIIETTANGFNEFKTFWDDSVAGLTNFKPLFYKASDFYSVEFLEQKRLELGEKFVQEYPENPIEAFIASGNKYFDGASLQKYLEETADVKSL
jgi:hypothetical protein